MIIVTSFAIGFPIKAQVAKKPVVVVTDLYHPHQDPGDNFDLINAYALPNIDLKAVLLDCHEPFRQEVAEGVGKGLFRDTDGPREPGFIPVEQLNYIFDRNVPCGVGPFTPMISVSDKMESIPVFQQSAVNLLAKILKEADEPITIVSFGSLRILAVANNRFPDLMRQKVKEIHMSAGTSNNHPEFLEWNAALDTNAFVSILRSDLPILIYPCAAGKITEKNRGKSNAFVADDGNTYYHLKDLSFVNHMDDRIRNYLDFVFSKAERKDYLSLLDKPYRDNGEIFHREQHMWETAIWMQVADLKLIKNEKGQQLIVPAYSVTQGDSVFYESLVPCDVAVDESGIFTYLPSENSDKHIYRRGDPEDYERWMNNAVPLYYTDYIDRLIPR